MTNPIVKLLATAALLAVAQCAVAQNVFTIEYPDHNAQIPINADQAVRVRWLQGGRPVVGGAVKLVTTRGMLMVDVAPTDDNGLATFSVSSTSIGTATLTATAPPVNPSLTATRVIEFVEADVTNPFGDFAVRSRDPEQLDLWIFKQRIGFIGARGVTIADVAQIAAIEGLVQLTPLADNIFVLHVPVLPANIDPVRYIRSLARSLELEYPEIEKAGRVARIVDSRQWLVIPDEIIANFPESQDDSRNIDLIGGYNPVGEPDRAPLDLSRYVFVLPVASDPTNDDEDDEDALVVAAELSANRAEVVYAEPNYIIPFDIRQSAPSTDEHFPFQWHHENDGANATEDADVDTLGAWTHTWGSQDVTIAVVDRGFEIDHPDLVDNLVCEPGEWCEQQGKRVEDVYDGDNTDLYSDSNDPALFAHGTRAAGVAAERGGNVIGYSGACPLCKLMLIRTEQTASYVATAYDHAIDRDVDIISNSWGIGVGDPNNPTIRSILDRIDTAVEEGITVLFAMSNGELNECGGPAPDISHLPNVIAVSGVTDHDKRSAYSYQALGYGPCMDVVAPTRGGEQGIRTTSVFKNGAGVPTPSYWFDFGGTSSATPLTAGVAGLMLSRDSQLSPLQVQRILQDTTDRVDPANADYSSEFGFSKPDGESTYGYGRINAMEAVRLVTPTAEHLEDEDFLPGRGGRDLLLRDHAYDWGNTEKPSSVIFDSPRGEDLRNRSVDIKIDVEPFKLPMPPSGLFDPNDFRSLQSEAPQSGKRSRVYVRLRNRGPYTVDEALVKLHVAVIEEALPDLPADFWIRFPADSTAVDEWVPLPRRDLTNILYSGPSIAGCPDRPVPDCHPLSAKPDDPALIMMFPLGAMTWDSDAGERLAFLAVAHSDDDPVQAQLPNAASLNFHDVVTAVTMDNNVTVLVSSLGFQCGTEIRVIVIVLTIFITLIVVYVIWRWINGRPVKITVYLTLLVSITIFVYVYIKVPQCVTLPNSEVVAPELTET